MASGEFQKARRAYERALKTSDLRVTSVSAAKGFVGALERPGEHAQALKNISKRSSTLAVYRKAVLEYRRTETLAALGRPKDAAGSRVSDPRSPAGLRSPRLRRCRMSSSRAAFGASAVAGTRPRANSAFGKSWEIQGTHCWRSRKRPGGTRRGRSLAQLEVDVLRRVDRDVQAEPDPAPIAT